MAIDVNMAFVIWLQDNIIIKPNIKKVTRKINDPQTNHQKPSLAKCKICEIKKYTGCIIRNFVYNVIIV